MPGPEKRRHRSDRPSAVRMRRLYERRRRGFDVEHVVDNLERESHRVRIAIERPSHIVAGVPRQCPEAHRRANQGAGLQAMHRLERIDRQRAAGRRQVDRLSARHAGDTRRLGQHRAGARGVVAGAREHGERESLQRIAGEQRGRFAECDVARRPPTAHRVVVHARQVVVHQRIRVDQLDRGGRRVDVVDGCAGQLTGGIGE